LEVLQFSAAVSSVVQPEFLSGVFQGFHKLLSHKQATNLKQQNYQNSRKKEQKDQKFNQFSCLKKQATKLFSLHRVSLF
jgi:hypothetical protein